MLMNVLQSSKWIGLPFCPPAPVVLPEHGKSACRFQKGTISNILSTADLPIYFSLSLSCTLWWRAINRITTFNFMFIFLLTTRLAYWCILTDVMRARARQVLFMNRFGRNRIKLCSICYLPLPNALAAETVLWVAGLPCSYFLCSCWICHIKVQFRIAQTHTTWLVDSTWYESRYCEINFDLILFERRGGDKNCQHSLWTAPLIFVGYLSLIQDKLRHPNSYFLHIR